MNLRDQLRAAIQAAPTGENAELLNRCYVALGGQQSQVPDGYALVPVEPSEKMLDTLYHNGPGLSDHLLVAIWAELLAAAPKAEPQPVSDGVPCSTHPDAPHGFNRDGSHSLDRYVCDCEGWVPPVSDDIKEQDK